jgi:hypothetical protein
MPRTMLQSVNAVPWRTPRWWWCVVREEEAGGGGGCVATVGSNTKRSWVSVGASQPTCTPRTHAPSKGGCT